MNYATLIMTVKTSEGSIQTVEAEISAADPRCEMVAFLRRDACPRDGWKNLHQVVRISWLQIHTINYNTLKWNARISTGGKLEYGTENKTLCDNCDKNSRMKGRGKNEEKLKLQNKNCTKQNIWLQQKKPHTHRADKESKSDKWEAKKYYEKRYWLGW